MSNLIEIWETPTATETYMIAGWHQWADAGAISSGLPQYLVDQTGAHKIGELKKNNYYIFQIPGTHHFLRPEIKLKDGYRQDLEERINEIYYHPLGNGKGLFIFLGHEPHLNAELYSTAFFQAVETLGVQRVGAVGGVYGAMPYDKDREVSCTYSLPPMKSELENYALKFSNYEGGVTIGSYLLDEAEKQAIEYLALYAFVPAYDFSQFSSVTQGMRIENDYKAWYDLMYRFNHMFGIELDLSELEQHSRKIVHSMDDKIQELMEQMPQLKIKEYLAEVTADFVENSFVPLGDVWKRELGDLFEDM